MGYWLALLAAVAWALPPNLARPVVRDGIPPLVATVATAGLALPIGYLIVRLLGRRGGFRQLSGRGLLFLGLTGVSSTTAFLCLYTALATVPVAVAVALASTYPLFNLVLVYLLERDERITPRVLLGTLAMVLGVVVVVL